MTTQELERRIFNLGTHGRGLIHYTVEYRGQYWDIETNNTFAYDRIREHNYGDLDDREMNENWLTYRQALNSLYADAIDIINEQ